MLVAVDTMSNTAGGGDSKLFARVSTHLFVSFPFSVSMWHPRVPVYFICLFPILLVFLVRNFVRIVTALPLAFAIIIFASLQADGEDEGSTLAALFARLR